MQFIACAIMATAVASLSPSRHRFLPSHRRVQLTIPLDETRLHYKSLNSPDPALPRSRAVNRVSPVQPIRTIKEYESLVLEEKDKMVIVRFHAPWCRVCKATSVSYERSAAKLQMAYPEKIKFFSVNINGSNEINELKDLLSRDHGLDIKGVPMGILYHPREQGIYGKVKLNRKRLRGLWQTVEMYLQEGGEADLVSLLDA